MIYSMSECLLNIIFYGNQCSETERIEETFIWMHWFQWFNKLLEQNDMYFQMHCMNPLLKLAII